MRTLKLELELVFFLGISSGLTLAKSFSLDWSPSPSPEVAGYTVYYGTTSEAYGMHLDAGTNISATVSGLPGGRIYFFAVSAYDPDGMESDPSNEISFSVPGVILPEQTSRTILELTLLTVTNTATGDNIRGSILTYSLAGPRGASIDTNGVITWIPTEAQGPSSNVFTTVATDNASPPSSATNTFVVIVNEANSPPLLPPQVDRTMSAPGSIVITNTAIDFDIPANPLTYALLTGPTNAEIDANGVITWVPRSDQAPSTNLITTLVTDYNPWAITDRQLSSANSFFIVVKLRTAPVLAGIPNYIIHAGSTIWVSNYATGGGPGNPLTFSLGNGAPPGATINPVKGLLSFVTSPSMVNTTNNITVVVTDRGSPPMSDSKTFSVIAVSPPIFQSATVSNRIVTLSWSSIAGKGYQLQYKDGVEGTSWSTLGSDIFAAGSTATGTDPVTGVLRFYRVFVLP